MIFSKGNALLVFLVSVAFLALSGMAMWFLSDITPLSVETSHIPNDTLAGVSSTETASDSWVETDVENSSVAPVAEEQKSDEESVVSLFVPSINPLSGAYTNPFE